MARMSGVSAKPGRRAAAVLAAGGLAAALAGRAPGAPATLSPEPAVSPDGRLAANIEWDDTGFIGSIKGIVAPAGAPAGSGAARSATLPEINPAPTDLLWLDDEWFGCQSAIGERGSGFFYMHAPTAQAYLLEVVAPEGGGGWLATLTWDDGRSSAAMPLAGRGREALFPALLRELPEIESEYFRPEFAVRVARAARAVSAWRAATGWRELEVLGAVEVSPEQGALAPVRMDGRPFVAWFPLGTTGTAEMLARTRLTPFDEAAARALAAAEPAPELAARWTDGAGGFAVLALPAAPAGARPGTGAGMGAGPGPGGTTATLMTGRVEGAVDTPPPPPEPPVTAERVPSVAELSAVATSATVASRSTGAGGTAGAGAGAGKRTVVSETKNQSRAAILGAKALRKIPAARAGKIRISVGPAKGKASGKGKSARKR